LQQVQQAETNLKAAQTNLDRNQQLFKDGLISQQQIDDLQNKVEAAQASLNSTRENVSQADTQIALLENGLENFVVRAPISGIINTKNYNLQEIYRANDVLYHVVNIDDVYINVDVPETYIQQIREGMQVSVTFNALGEQRFGGTVETVLPSSTTANRTFTAKVRVKNPGHAIKPGMFASVQIALAE
jgi:RND family efflux transporter MFP subunit